MKKPAGSSPALRIPCPVCGSGPGACCIKGHGEIQIIAHRKRRVAEEASRTEQAAFLVNGKRAAYTVTTVDGRNWGVGIVVDGDAGYRPVHEYGPYADERRAQGVVVRLNVRINVDTETANRIVASSMRKAALSS